MTFQLKDSKYESSSLLQVTESRLIALLPLQQDYTVSGHRHIYCMSESDSGSRNGHGPRNGLQLLKG